MTNNELLAILAELSQEHFDAITAMVEEMNAHSRKQRQKRLAVMVA